MNFLQQLKSTARNIITLSDALGSRAHSWDQEDAAPIGGYTDRAGFIIYDNIQLFADVYLAEEGDIALVRARLALDSEDVDIFNTITLDFNADKIKVQSIISQKNTLTATTLVSLIDDPDTIPRLIHVSFKSGIGNKGESLGRRYSYQDAEIQTLIKSSQKEFIDTLNKTYAFILSKINS